MAKSRKKSKTVKSSPSRRSTKASGRPKVKATPPRKLTYPTTQENQIELRPIRLQLQADVGRLGAAIAARREAQPVLEEALKRMSRWLDDIQDICGPNMSIPLS